MKKTAVIPAYNEQARIGRVIERTRRFVDEVIVVDDGSIDATASVAGGKGAHVISLRKNKGAGFATRAGCDFAVKTGADIIITLDADGQHDPDDIPHVLAPVLSGRAEVVFGIRPRDKRMPFSKRVANAFLSVFAGLLFGGDIQDALTGFHVFTRGAYKKLRWDSNDYGMVSEIVYRTVKHRLLSAQVTVQTIYIGKKNGMRKRDGLRLILLMLAWKIKKR